MFQLCERTTAEENTHTESRQPGAWSSTAEETQAGRKTHTHTHTHTHTQREPEVCVCPHMMSSSTGVQLKPRGLFGLKLRPVWDSKTL